MTDEDALRLGRELAELVAPDLVDQFGDAHEVDLISLGRIAVKLAEPYVLEKIREPTQGMIEAWWTGLDDHFPNDVSVKAGWQAMIDARLQELRNDRSEG